MAQPLGYRVIEVDLSVAHDDEPYPVGSRRLSVVHVDDEAYVKLNTRDAQRIRLAPGTLWTGSHIIEELFITNAVGTGILQILVGEAVCADFSSAAQEGGGDGEVVAHLLPYSPNAASTAAYAMRDVRSAAAANADTAGASANGGVSVTGYRSEWGQVVLNAADLSATVGSRYQHSWLQHPSLPLAMMENNGRDLTPYIGEVWALRMRGAARIAANAVGGPGKTRSSLGIGRPSPDGGIAHFVGAGFIADLNIGGNWLATLSPYNDAVAGEDPYYYRVDTGIPVVNYEDHVFEIRIGVASDGLPKTQWLIDEVVVGSYEGYLDATDGTGAARDGRFGVAHVFSAGWGATKILADAAALAWQAVRSIEYIRGTRFG